MPNKEKFHKATSFKQDSRYKTSADSEHKNKLFNKEL
jgi:hypothetical protein